MAGFESTRHARRCLSKRPADHGRLRVLAIFVLVRWACAHITVVRRTAFVDVRPTQKCGRVLKVGTLEKSQIPNPKSQRNPTQMLYLSRDAFGSALRFGFGFGFGIWDLGFGVWDLTVSFN